VTEDELGSKGFYEKQEDFSRIPIFLIFRIPLDSK
jgi:hypothetical protein